MRQRMGRGARARRHKGFYGFSPFLFSFVLVRLQRQWHFVKKESFLRLWQWKKRSLGTKPKCLQSLFSQKSKKKKKEI